MLSTAKGSFDEAVKSGKIVNVQKVIDDTKTRFEQLSTSLTSSAAGVTGLIDQYKKHAEEMAKPVDTDFTDLDFKAGTAVFLFDRPTSKATLEKLVAYMKSCPQLVVDLVGHTSNEGPDCEERQAERRPGQGGPEVSGDQDRGGGEEVPGDPRRRRPGARRPRAGPAAPRRRRWEPRRSRRSAARTGGSPCTRSRPARSSTARAHGGSSRSRRLLKQRDRDHPFNLSCWRSARLRRLVAPSAHG